VAADHHERSRRHSARQAAKPNEVADLVTFLVSPRAASITGTEYVTMAHCSYCLTRWRLAMVGDSPTTICDQLDMFVHPKVFPLGGRDRPPVPLLAAAERERRIHGTLDWLRCLN